VHAHELDLFNKILNLVNERLSAGQYISLCIMVNMYDDINDQDYYDIYKRITTKVSRVKIFRFSSHRFFVNTLLDKRQIIPVPTLFHKELLTMLKNSDKVISKPAKDFLEKKKHIQINSIKSFVSESKYSDSNDIFNDIDILVETDVCNKNSYKYGNDCNSGDWDNIIGYITSLFGNYRENKLTLSLKCMKQFSEFIIKNNDKTQSLQEWLDTDIYYSKKNTNQEWKRIYRLIFNQTNAQNIGIISDNIKLILNKLWYISEYIFIESFIAIIKTVKDNKYAGNIVQCVKKVILECLDKDNNIEYWKCVILANILSFIPGIDSDIFVKLCKFNIFWKDNKLSEYIVTSNNKQPLCIAYSEAIEEHYNTNIATIYKYCQNNTIKTLINLANMNLEELQYLVIENKMPYDMINNILGEKYVIHCKSLIMKHNNDKNKLPWIFEYDNSIDKYIKKRNILINDLLV
jgi:hypothetical protein